MDQHDDGNGKGGPGRPLGRGLQDVSHLFLSPRPGDAPGRTEAPGASPAVDHTPVPLRPASVTRERLAALLPLDWSGALEDGLHTIDVRVPCYPCGEIDVLAVDRTGKLTIIDFETSPNDGLLLRGINHVEWVARNTPTLQRMCPGYAFDAALSPRLILLAPQFSPMLRRAMRQLTRPQIQWVRYHAVEMPAGPGVFFEPVTGE